jgi:uncharacterized protein (TIGR02147 family)
MLTVEAKLPPRVLEFEDYHLFLRAFFDAKKGANPSFSYRRFAQLAGIKSSNYLLLVMNGKRRLSPAMARAVAKAMKLDKAEADYFVALVKLERCKTPEERAEINLTRKVAAQKIVSHILPVEKAEYLSVWYYPLIRELAFLPDFVAKPAWIADKLRGLVTEKQAERTIEVLVNLGLWSTDATGRVTVQDAVVDTGPESTAFGRIKLIDIHRENLRAWAKILDQTTPRERELGLINIPVNANKVPEFKRRIRAFQDEIIAWLQDEKEPTQVVQLGTYLVPVTRPED